MTSFMNMTSSLLTCHLWFLSKMCSFNVFQYIISNRMSYLKISTIVLKILKNGNFNGRSKLKFGTWRPKKSFISKKISATVFLLERTTFGRESDIYRITKSPFILVSPPSGRYVLIGYVKNGHNFFFHSNHPTKWFKLKKIQMPEEVIVWQLMQ